VSWVCACYYSSVVKRFEKFVVPVCDSVVRVRVVNVFLVFNVQPSHSHLPTAKDPSRAYVTPASTRMQCMYTTDFNCSMASSSDDFSTSAISGAHIKMSYSAPTCALDTTIMTSTQPSYIQWTSSIRHHDALTRSSTLPCCADTTVSIRAFPH